MEYLNQFAQQDSIQDIFKYISTLPSPKEKGDAFEILTKIFFEYDERCIDVEKVWCVSLCDGVPPSVLKELNMPEKDMGVDLIAKTVEGKYWFIQSKFRSNPSNQLIWGEHLSTFEALSMRKMRENSLITRLILFANVYDCPEQYKTENTLSAFLHNDIMSSENLLPNIKALVNKQEPIQIVKTPRPYQQDVIDITEGYYEEHDRGKTILPCGAGKTITSIWATKVYINGFRSPIIWHILPTLDIVGQHLHNFLQVYPEHRLGLWNILIVASDMADEQCDNRYYDISTQENEFDAYFEKFQDKPQVIFSTYASAEMFWKYLQKQQILIELCIIDEAHMTAGSKSSRIGTVIEEDNEVILKYMFLTATEKIIAENNKDQMDLVNCMSNTEVYGNYITNISFRKLYNLGIELGTPYLCDYSIEFIVEANNDYDPNKYVLSDDKPITASMVASVSLINNKFDDGSITHCIAYINYNKDAKIMYDLAKQIFPEDIKIFRIDGSMNSNKRNRILHEYETSPRAIIFNARLLRLAIDLPITDGIAICSEITSVIDIVQMIMRGSRLYPGKNGFKIIIPCVIENVDNFIANEGDFKMVRKVISSLSDFDSELREEWLIKYGGSKKTYSGKRRLVINMGKCLERINIDNWMDCFETQSLSSSKIRELNWQKKYNLVAEYVEEYGKIPSRSTVYHETKLGNWIDLQRTNYKNHKLNQNRVDLLQKIPNWYWEQDLDGQWMKTYKLLKEYVEEYGKLPIRSTVYHETNLGEWLDNQRTNYKNHKLNQNRVDLLQKIPNWYWEQDLDGQWMKTYKLLKEYVEEYGKLSIRSTVYHETKLGNWINKQRTNYKKHKISRDRIDLLQKIPGWYWIFGETLEESQRKRQMEPKQPKEKTPELSIKEKIKQINNGELSNRKIIVRELKQFLDDNNESYKAHERKPALFEKAKKYI